MDEKIVKDSQGLAKELVNGVKEFEELKVIDLNGRPYYSIIYLENGNEFEGYASYNLKVISEYLKRHFGFAQPETHDKRTEKHACDCISRKAAIDAMEQAKEQYFDRRVIIGKMQNVVSNLPSAQPEQQWIPCSERLPDRFGKMLVTFIPGTLWTYVIIANYSDLMGIAKPCFWIGNVGKSDFANITSKVVAWMPLPKGYQTKILAKNLKKVSE